MTHHPHLKIEPLESRIAPATLIAIDDLNNLLRFNSSSTGSVTTIGVTNLGADEALVGIDFRPATGVLYGLTIDPVESNKGRLYTIDPVSGAATLASTLAAAMGDAYTALNGANFGVDFNPQADRLRVVSDTEQNLRIDVATGAVTTDTALTPGDPAIGGAAYTNSFPGATSTTLYDIDLASNALVQQGNPSPNDGVLTVVGTDLGIGDVTGVAGFDIGHGKNEAFAALTVGGTTSIYSINLTNGTASSTGAIGGSPNVRGLAIVLHTWDGSTGSTSATNAANWVAGIAPVAGDSLLFPAGPTAKTVVVSGVNFNSLRFTGSGYDYNGGTTKLDGNIAAHAVGTVKLSNIDLRGTSSGRDQILAEQAGTTLEFTTITVDANGGRGVEFKGAGTVKVKDLATSGTIVQTVVDGPNLIANGYTGSIGTRLLSGSITVIDDFTDVSLEGGTLRALFDPEGKNVVGSIISGAITATGGTLESGLASLDVQGNVSLNAATTAAFIQPAEIGLQPLRVNGTVSLGGAMLAVTFAGTAPGRLTLIDNDDTDAVTGTFNGLNEGATVSFGGQDYSISYVGGNGNDVVLTKIGDSAPTTISGGTATFQDVDGDDVKVKVSKGTLAAGNFVLRAQGLGAQLELLDLSSDDNFAGATITITATRSAMGGDGSVNVGFIDATGIDLGAVTVGGDLGGIDAGDPDTVGGLKGLTVQSLGVLGLATGAPDLRSDIDGPLDKLTVRGDVRHANVHVFDSKFTSPETYDGRIGKIMINGSLRGGDVQLTGRIESGRDIGTLTILGDLRGGAGPVSGTVESGDIGSVSIMGSIIGGDKNFSGSIFAFGPVKSVKIAGDIIGGAGGDSGQVEAHKGLGSLSIGGSVLGGSGFNSAEIQVEGLLGSLSIGGFVMGGAGSESAHIILESVKSVSIAESVIGIAEDSAMISIDDGASSIFVGGSVIGGDDRSAQFVFGDDFSGQEPVGMIKIVGSVLGGAGDFSGQIITIGELKSLSVGGAWLGGAGGFSGRFVGDKVGSVSVKSSFAGGAGGESGQFDLDEVGTVSIGGNFMGGAGQRSGYLKADSIVAMSVGRSMLSGTGAGSGRVEVEGDLGALTVNGSMSGTAANPLVLMAGGVSTPVKGADVVLGKLTVKGSVDQVRIHAGFGSAPFSTTVTGRNPDAQIGSVMVTGDWIASSISAGVQGDATATLNASFGDADDRKIQGGGVTDDANINSKIASIVIKGQAFGTAGGSDHFGFVAQEIGVLKVGAVTFPLTLNPPIGQPGNPDDPDANDPLLLIGGTGDLRVHEVAL